MNLALLRKILWVLVGVAALSFAMLLLWDSYRSEQGSDEPQVFRAAFELTDHQGIVRTQADFAGRWMLVFFGFANCPDVCPTTLSEVAAVMDLLGNDAEQVQPLFISIDPERDTPEVLADFVPRFDAGIIGLTGTPAQIALTSDTFHIFFERIEEASAPDGYTMGHSSQLFLFNPDAGYTTSWQYGTPAEEILVELREYME
nr:SCO family protein [Nioella ostreopsis]